VPETEPIINVRRFIEATRDSGYKSTTSAMSELVDNSIQAQANNIHITIERSDSPDFPLQISVADDGCGMVTADLRRCLQFGGSSRFGNRGGLGRYGMGLPNASLSQCRRVEVVTWTNRSRTLSCWIDVDEIVEGKMKTLPSPSRVPRPKEHPWDSGTVVTWCRCDRLDNTRMSTIERKISAAIGRMFRHFIWSGVSIKVNEKAVPGLDPLFLHQDSPGIGATLHGKKRMFRVRTTPESRSSGKVEVVFSRLPVERWASLSNEEKRARGIANGAGISVVRAGREIDYGWHFTGNKRKENYDDWWRCEISFDPSLDEAFGITHTKQQIRPRTHLLEALVPEIESVAKSLNAAVRKDFQDIKSAVSNQPLEAALVKIEQKLPPIRKRRVQPDELAEVASLRERHTLLRDSPPKRNGRVGEYRLVHDAGQSKALFDVHTDEGRLVIVLNKRHPLFRKVLGSQQDNERVTIAEVRLLIEQIIASAARAEVSLHKTSEVEVLRSFRQTWGHTLSLLLNE